MLHRVRRQVVLRQHPQSAHVRVLHARRVPRRGQEGVQDGQGRADRRTASLDGPGQQSRVGPLQRYVPIPLATSLIRRRIRLDHEELYQDVHRGSTGMVRPLFSFGSRLTRFPGYSSLLPTITTSKRLQLVMRSDRSSVQQAESPRLAGVMPIEAGTMDGRRRRGRRTANRASVLLYRWACMLPPNPSRLAIILSPSEVSSENDRR